MLLWWVVARQAYHLREMLSALDIPAPRLAQGSFEVGAVAEVAGFNVTARITKATRQLWIYSSSDR